MLEEFTESLKKGLSEELPGGEAQNMMMPIARDKQYKFPTFDTEPVPSAVLILFYEEGGLIKFPLIQRPTYNGAHSGQIALPGGKAEKSDLNLMETALRETHEEIGVDPETVKVIGELSELHIAVSNFTVSPVIGIAGSKPSFVPDMTEVEGVIEANVFDLFDPAKRKTGSINVRENLKIHTPFFELNGKVVWGATAMMLSELTAVIEKTQFFKERMNGE